MLRSCLCGISSSRPRWLPSWRRVPPWWRFPSWRAEIPWRFPWWTSILWSPPSLWTLLGGGMWPWPRGRRCWTCARHRSAAGSLYVTRRISFNCHILDAGVQRACGEHARRVSCGTCSLSQLVTSFSPRIAYKSNNRAVRICGRRDCSA